MFIAGCRDLEVGTCLVGTLLQMGVATADFASFMEKASSFCLCAERGALAKTRHKPVRRSGFKGKAE